MKVIGQLGRNDWLEDEEIREIFNLLDNQALFVGGCVRDSLLGKSVKDIDIRCDLHARWSRDGKRISYDTTENRKREIAEIMLT